MLAGNIMVQAKKLDEDACWSAILERRENASEPFVFAVVTTGIFCRPSCPARRPKRENMRLFRSADEARRAGFRACKRCAPEGRGLPERQADIVAELCRRIEEAEDMPSFADLAEQAGMSAFHLHRLFKRETGVTPKAYMAGVKAQRMRDGLGTAGSVTEAIYEAGYGSSSRFYENADAILGMEPRQFRDGGKHVRISYAVESCWLGKVLIGLTERGVCAILFGDEEKELVSDLKARFPAAGIETAGTGDAARIAEALAAIDEPRLGSHLPLDIAGTAFQQRIWAALRGIKPGKTASYAEIAKRVGAPKAVRAVAGACAANPAAVAIPCHRVVRSDGGLSGYRWGVERKRKLLEREKKSVDR
ncbi:MAG: bifunctional DNA-binding transcriptional regulator/O6-methylguanine-DNA methyltransferase Ada [Rhodomicrobiaceae bacterium]